MDYICNNSTRFHTVRSESGSFFYTLMTTKKPAYSILEQIHLLKSRGMLFKNESLAPHFLNNISYYRLKGYWWDMQLDYEKHTFRVNTYFEDVVDRYNFDRHLRIILFDAIERIEIALRTKMIHHFAISYGGLWYLNSSLFYYDVNNAFNSVASSGFIFPAKTKLNCFLRNAASYLSFSSSV